MLDALRLLRRFRGHPRCSREEIVAFQEERLRALVQHAYQNVPWYRRHFDAAGVNPDEIRGLADLGRIPITTKQQLRGCRPEEVVARGYDPERLLSTRTSGSTGEPFRIRHTKRERRLHGFLRFRSMRAHGLRRRDRLVMLMNRNSTIRYTDPVARGRLARRFGPQVQVIHALQPRDTILEELERARPDVLLGLTGVVAHVAGAVGDAAARGLSPRFVRVGGEVLTPAMRRRIEGAFQAPVRESYGCWEGDLLGWSCRETDEMHVCDDGVLLEVLVNGRPAAEGEAGEVVLTALHAYAMPFVRYRLHDIAIRGREACACGQPFSTLRGVEGRMIDYFRLSDGRVLNHYQLSAACIVPAETWVDQYRMVQEALDDVRIEICPTRPPTEAEKQSVIDGARGVLGDGVRVTLALVETIPPDASGKYRVSISKLGSFYGADDDTPDA